MTARTAFEIAEGVRSGEVSAADAVSMALGRIEDGGGGPGNDLNAFTQVFHERALEQARAIDTRVASGDAAGLALAGVPIAVKDNICVSWGRTTAGSRMLESYRSPFSATAVRRLVSAGAVIVGKTNMDEFGMGSSGEHSAFGPTRNPRDRERVPGGSSGGSAAAVGAGMVPAALGSDTGGSIRQPAAHCGAVGLKPTYGRVSRYGLIAYASSLDCIGPIAGDVRDAALVLEAMAGADAHDATCSERPAPSLTAGIDEPIERLRVGVVRPMVGVDAVGAVHPSVEAAVRRAASALGEVGAEIVDVKLPNVDHAVSAYYVVAPAEASSNLARYDGVRYGMRASLEPGDGIREMFVKTRCAGFGEEVKRRIMLGTYVLSAGYAERHYLRALRVRRVIKRGYDDAFGGAVGEGGVHALLSPVTPGPAFRIGEKAGDPLSMYLEDVYTVGVNLAGLPALSVPAGEAVDGVGGVGLPVGVQLVGRAFDESTLLRVGRALETALSGVGASA